MAILFWVAVLSLLVATFSMVELSLGTRRIPELSDITIAPSQDLPSVSIVIAARNEEAKIGPALKSVLELDYPNYEIVVVNDRSTDQTKGILDGMAALHSRLRVVSVADLPEGWLGKNHALQRGAKIASGDYLLFTDADVIFDRTALRRAVGYLRTGGFDHLSIGPEIKSEGFWYQLTLHIFAAFFLSYMKPWKVSDPRSSRFLGVGAFNLISRAVYLSLGGHEPIRLRPDDDLMLGRLVKKKGYRQAFLFGHGLVTVRWYENLGEFVRGLEKNVFSGVNYSVALMGFLSLIMVACVILPLPALFFTQGITRVLFAATLLVYAIGFWDNAPRIHIRRGYGLALPIGAAIYLYVMWNAILKALYRGGIVWRGTRYRLKDLKSNRI